MYNYIHSDRSGHYLTMTPTAQAAAKATDIAAALTTAAAISASSLKVARLRTAAAEAIIDEEDTATETPMRPSIEEAGKVMAAAPAATMIDSVTVAPVQF